MLISIAAMIVWEGWGRDALLLTEVVAAGKTLQAGHLLQAEDVQLLKVPRDCVVEGALTAGRINELSGHYTLGRLSLNQQISIADIADEEELVKEQQTTFVIPQEWIAMRSSSLRKGDRITLYRLSDYGSLGTYTIAFVKNEQEQEVYSLEGIDDRKLLDRTDGSAPINHVEIIAELSQYQIIREAALVDGGLLLLQGEGSSVAADTNSNSPAMQEKVSEETEVETQ